MKCFAPKQKESRKAVFSPARPNSATPALWPSSPSVEAAPAVVRRQPDKQGNPRDLKKLLKDPCFGERVDDTKARCQFSDRQRTFVRIVREHALRRCARAIRAINMPGLEGEVKRKAKEYFHLDVKLSEKTKRTLIRTITAISDQLKNTPIECGTCQDEGCNRGLLAYVPPGRGLLVLCPPFFMDEILKVHLTPRSLIHEAGHLAGVNTPSRDEMYCHQGEITKDDKCPVVDAIHNADAWAHFINELSYSI